MKSKRGGMVDKNLIELILAAAGVFLLVTLMVSLFTPSFDKEDELAESYLNNLEEAIKLAESGGEGDFFMMDVGDKDVDFYLIYFGGMSIFEDFTYLGSGRNIVCVCYVKGDDSLCNHCIDLDSPINYIEKGGISKDIPWAVEEGVRASVIKGEGGAPYVFVEK